MVAHWEGVTKSGSVAEELVSMADVTPTFVEAAGGSLDAGAVDGKSFLKMLRGEQVVNHRTVLGAFTNCNIIGSRERVYPIRVIRNKNFSLIYNPEHEAITSNVTLDQALAMTTGKATKGDDVAASWVALAQSDPAAGALVRKLHHRAEYELYHLKNDPYELVNVIDNPEFAEVAARLKKQLHARLSALGDEDPVATERGMVAPKRKKK